MSTKKSHSDQAIDLANKRAYARKYYHNNKARSRAYYLANSERIKFRAQAWRLANRERYLEQQAAYDRNRRVLSGYEKRVRDIKNHINPEGSPHK